jgi:hypothetical protein
VKPFRHSKPLTARHWIDWSAPRLICVAGDFNRYDDHAIKQMQRNIELIRYRRFGTELLLLDLLTATSAKGAHLPCRTFPIPTIGSPYGDPSANRDKIGPD